ncbi:pyridoxal-phosphate dependent enzyme [Candidatus Stoquefichus massiliensis]|uniref:pyridoxal-phosphate dependent enzyme n=1 Tax=Candidatus Stoquefichus massiliensis TaxID=1470350 RepID=UPI0004B6351F|nr:pyridoxal-phosphate dependent enzyme [Candidatus Stoquefichus massiliensis]
MKILLRRFNEDDIDKKIEWINNPLNNKYLHYSLPLKKENTLRWFANIKDKKDRLDLVIECDGIAVGIIGLLNINQYGAELYITIGERKYLGKGIAKKALLVLKDYAFETLNLSKLILVTEIDNLSAQALFDKVGFIRYGIKKKDVLRDGAYRDRYYYELHNRNCIKTPIYALNDCSNQLFVKRDDLIPFSFGGNKARKAILFFEDIQSRGSDYIVTYGTSSSNHCRIVANLAKSVNLACLIISPIEQEKETYNKKIIKLLDAEVVVASVSDINDTINREIERLKNQGFNPYFIEGGGHGNLGTKAMIDCYKEIYDYEMQENIHFDYIFFASGTGTTQAGLVLGKILYNDNAHVVGISIARKYPYGRDIVINSMNTYLKENGFNLNCKVIEEETVFVDDYTGDCYGSGNSKIKAMINNVFFKYGIPLDTTYTGKAFYGMMEYIKANHIENKNILFIHTGGTPLFFNELEG